MKCLPILALGALVAAQPMQAQRKFGVIAGVVSTNISSSADANNDAKAKVGFAFGVATQWSLGSGGNLMLAPEVLYVQKGFKVEDSGESGKFKLNYIEVPVLLQYNIGDKAKVIRPYVSAGPTIAFKAGCKVAADDNSVDCDDVSFKVKSMDIGIMAALGFAGERWAASARYEAGLSNFNDNGTDTSVKNKMLAFMVSFWP